MIHCRWSGSQSARRSAQRPHDATDLTPTVCGMTGIPRFLFESILDLEVVQAGPAKIDPKPEECFVTLT